MHKENKVKIDEAIDNKYLEQLEEMDYPVIKRTVLTQDEFNEELRAGYCEATPSAANHNNYLEAIEAMGFPVIKQTQMSQEEFNELLKSGYISDIDAEYKTLITRKLLEINNDLAMVS